MTKFALNGAEPAADAIRNSLRAHAWRVLTTKPAPGKENEILVSFTKVTETKEAKAKAFLVWAENLKNQNNVNGQIFYLEIGRFRAPKEGQKKVENTVLPFRLDDGQEEAEEKKPEKPQSRDIGSEELRLKCLRLEWENDRLREENDELKASILDDDEDEDEEEESGLFGINENTPLGQAASTLIQHFAGQITGQQNPVISALQEIKKAAPEAEQVIILLSQRAKTNPEEIKAFVQQIHQGLTNPS